MKQLKLISLGFTLLFASLTVKSQVPCPGPTGVKVTDITQTSAIIKWNKIANACYYIVFYNTANSTLQLQTKDTVANLTKLTSGALYYAKVQSYCPASGTTTCTAGEYSQYLSFTTLKPETSCAPPASLVNIEIGTTGVAVKWSKVAGACSYNVKLFYYGTKDTLVKNTKDTVLNISGLKPATYYHWRVQTVCCNSSIPSPWSKDQIFTTLTACYTPAAGSFTTTAITQTSAQISWTAVTGACKYYIVYYPTNNTTASKVLITPNITYKLDSLTPGTAYTWKVKTLCCTNGQITSYSEFGALQTFTTLAKNCAVPLNLKVTNLSATSVTLSWNAVSGVNLYMIEYWNSSTANNHSTANSQTNSITITGLTPNTAYEWKVKTKCGNGILSDFSAVSHFTTFGDQLCKPPLKPAALKITNKSATLTWNKVPNACSYIVWYSTSTAFTPYRIVTTRDTAVSIDSLSANTYYVWKVKTICCNNTGSSEFSTLGAFKTLPLNPPHTCTAPTIFANSNLTSTSVTIKWNKIADGCSYYIKYYVYGTKDTVFKSTQDTIFNITGLKPGTYYHWNVLTVCCNQTGTSAWSHYQLFTTLTAPACNAPAKANTLKITQTSATLTWSKVEGACGYMYYITPLNGTVYETKDTSVTILNLKPSTNYTWIVKTVCCSGSISEYVSQTFTTLPAENTCVPPREFKSTEISQTSAYLIWSAVTNACGYIIYYWPNNNLTIIYKKETKNLKLLIDSLKPNSEYQWKVQTVCCDPVTGARSLSDFGPVQTFKTLSTATCPVPINLKYTNLTPTSVVLSWDAISSGFAYIVEYWNSITINSHFTVTVTTNSAIITGLTPNTFYEWKVKTYCGNGLMSDFSRTSNFTTPAAAQTCKPPLHPASLNITQKSAVLTWNKVPNACSYIIWYSTSTAFTPYSVITTKDTAVTLMNLTAATYYLWKVQTVCCDQIGNSEFCPVLYFKTPAGETCKAPSVFKTSNISLTGAAFAWNKVDGSCGYVVTLTNYSNYPTTTTKTFTTKDTSITALELSPNTYYHWAVATVCCNGVTSINGPDQPFMTLSQKCEIPAGFTTTSITQTSAMISWNEVKGACGYYVIYYPTNNTAAYKIITTKDLKITIDGLLPKTVYQWKVRTVCCTNSTASTYSDYGAVQTFTTLQSTCTAPVKFASSNLTSTSIILKWNKVPHACSYNVSYSPYSTGIAIVINTKDTVLNLTGLTPGTYYHWMAQTLCCDNMGASEYGRFQIFTTPAIQSCYAPKAITVLKIGTTSVSLSWVAVEGVCGYSISYNIPGVTDFITVTTKNPYIIIDGLKSNSPYHLYLRSICCTGGLSSTFADVNFTTYPIITPQCNAPINLKHSEITQTSALLTWDAVNGAISYLVSYWVVGYANTPLFQTVNINKALLTGLLPNTKYEWKVKTYCSTVSGGTSDWSLTDNFITLAVPQIDCQTPANPASVDIFQTTAKLVWNKVPHACYYTIILYEANNTASYKTFSVKDTSLILTGLTAGKTYMWKVKTKCCDPASNAVGESEFTPLQTFVTLPYQHIDCIAPVVLNSSNVTQRNAVIKWNSVKSAGVYLIAYWSVNDPNSIFYLKTQDTSLILINLLPNTKYYWKVKVYCATNSSTNNITSDWSQTVDFTTLSEQIPTCAPPDNLVNGTITQNSALLKWNKVPGVTSYVVIYYPVNSPTTAFKSISTKDTAVQITGLLPNTEYIWKVKTICCGPNPTTPCFYSTDSHLQGFTTLKESITTCLPPTKPVVTNITQYSAVLKWNRAENACYYLVYYTSEITMQPGFLSIKTKDTTVTLTNLIANMNYDWKVKAICCSSTGTMSESDFSPMQYFKTLNNQDTKCNAPQYPSTINVTQTSAVINWNYAVNACSYLVIYFPSGSVNQYKYFKTTDTTTTLTGLLPNTKYEWKVKTICCNTTGTYGESEFTVPQVFTTLMGETIKCLAPTTLESGNITHNSALLKWIPVQNACSYIVVYYYMTTDGSTPKYFYVKTPVPYVNLTGLMPGIEYKWKVQTICCSPNSNTVSTSDYSVLQFFTTLRLPVECNPPKFLVSGSVTNNSAKLIWNKVSGASKYILYIWTANTAPVIQIINNDTVFFAQNLLASTVYQWKVLSVCYSNSQNTPFYSVFSYTATFTTLSKPVEACTPPIELSTTGITANQAIISWSAVNATYYIIAYKPFTGTMQYKYVITKANKYLLKGLLPNTQYIWKVRSICSASTSNLYSFSDYSLPALFTTLADNTIQRCIPPDGLKSYDITDTSANLGWNGVAGVRLYLVIYNEANSNDIIYKIVPDIKLALSNLKPSTKYIWKVGSICLAGGGYNIGKLSDTTTFITKPKGGKKFTTSGNSDNLNFKVYPNPSEGIINVEIDNINSPANLSITNFAGQLVYNETVHNSANEIKEIDLSKQPKGIYFIKVINNTSVKTLKLVIH